MSPALPVAPEPVRMAVRRLRWFRAALLSQIDAISAETGVSYQINDRALAAAFVAWLRRVEAQNPRDPGRRRAFFDFAAGLMLHELMLKMPLRAGPLPAGADRDQPEYFWPEGFACTVFCVNLRAAVIAQEFDATTEVTPAFSDIRGWWSFRENVREQASTAIGFFDLFVGIDPDWMMPTIFRDKLRRAVAKEEERPLGDLS
jgi:hypothetical protein